MIIIRKKADLFRLNCEALVNPVNCVGVSGAGLARQFRFRFPNNDVAYRQACITGDLRIGTVFPFFTQTRELPHIIFNFPTKNHWRDPSKLEYIELGIRSLRRRILQFAVRSIAIPALGCGHGQLSWLDVGPLIERNLPVLDGAQYNLIPPQK